MRCYKWLLGVFRHMCRTVRQKNDLFIQAGWTVTLFSRPTAVPPSDGKNVHCKLSNTYNGVNTCSVNDCQQS